MTPPNKRVPKPAVFLAGANILGYSYHPPRPTGTPHVECGSLPPLFAVRACPGVLPAVS